MSKPSLTKITLISKSTWLLTGFQTEDQLAGLHVEQTNLPICEGCDQVGWITAD